MNISGQATLWGLFAFVLRWTLLVPLYAAPRFVWRSLWPSIASLRMPWLPLIAWVLPVLLYACSLIIDACLADLPAGLRATFMPWTPAAALQSVASAGGRMTHRLLQPGCEGLALTVYRITLCTLGAQVGAFTLSTLFGAPFHVWSQGLRADSRLGPTSMTHGAARWETTRQAQSAGFLKPHSSAVGLVLGRVSTGVGTSIDPRYQAKGHILTCAPSGAGKGIGCVIPNLLQYPGSAFVLDVKAENYVVTAARRLELGQGVARLDPFGLCGRPSHAFNWLSGIDVEREGCIADAAQLAEALVIRGNGPDSHWDDSAHYLIQGLVLYIASLAPAQRHIGTLRALLTMGHSEQQELLESLCASKVAFGRVGRMARSFLNKDERERAGVLSTALRHTSFLDDPRIERTLKANSFDFGQLKTERLTVYLVMPPDKLGAYAGYMRATLVLALQAMVQQRHVPEDEVVFILDEVAQLGRLTVLEDAIAIMRGYSVRLWLLVQDLGQIKNVYRKWTSFLASSTLQVFGVQDNDTARYVSEALGNETIWVHSSGNSSNQGTSRASRSSSTNRSAISRPLLTAEEVRTLPATEVLVFSPGRKPHRLRRLNYLQDKETRQLARPSPLHAA